MTCLRLLFLASLAACAGAPTSAPSAPGLSEVPTVARLTPVDPAAELTPAFARYELVLGDRQLDVLLSRNDDLFAPGYVELRRDGDVDLPHPPSAWANANPCYYQGSVLEGGVLVGSLAARTCDGLTPHRLVGLLQLDERLYDLAPTPEGHSLALARWPEAGFDDITGIPHTDLQDPPRIDGQLPASGNNRYVELLVVNDPGRTASLGGNPETSTATRLHLVSSLYLGSDFTQVVRPALVGQLSLTGTSPFNPATAPGGGVSSNDLLSQFLAWDDGTGVEADHRILMSALDFDSSTVGLAPVGGMCTTTSSGSIIQATFSNALDAATTAHELGHNLGMLHDGVNNSCPSSGFLMSTVSCTNCPSQPTRFSSCSVAEAMVGLDGGFPCLDDEPGAVFGGPDCGNGLVESGEQCDCGAEGCATIDPCCNGNTCQYASPNFTCSALDACCNAATCRPVSAGANLVCREANDVDCDLEEVCDGTSGSCPPDQTEDNGQTCGVGGACLLGACGSINGQCDELGALFGVQLLASPTCTSLINQDGCGDLVCRMGGSSSCTTLNDGSGLIQVEDGAPCGVGEQCFEGACLPTGDLPAANDQCPADPNKTTPGTCGCGVADVDADTDAVIDCVEPTPQIEAISGQAGGTLTFQVDNGTPGQRVHIVAGRPGGTVNVPGCSGSTLNLQSVTLLGFVTANAQGRAQLVRSPPANLGGVQRTFYAVELSSCGVSAPVAHTL